MERLPQYPDVSAVVEFLPDTVVNGWFVLVVPRGTPQDIIARLAAAVERSTAQPDVVARMAALGMYSVRLSGPDLERFIRSEQALCRQTTAQPGVQRQ